MMATKETAETAVCRHCGYTWTPRKPRTVKCPDCYGRWPRLPERR